MYFKVGPVEVNERFSWMICKRPGSILFRDLGRDGRRATGNFVDDDSAFELKVVNDPVDFLHVARKNNFQAYVHLDLTSVCPSNLKAVDDIFRTIIRGRNGTSGYLSDEKVFAPLMWKAILGPFFNDIEYLESVFTPAGIQIKKANEDNDPYAQQAAMVEFRNKEPMSLTEFLQKIYVLSYMASYDRRSSLYHVEEEQIVKFVNLCKNWIINLENKNTIINKLCGHNKKLIQKFESGIADSIEEYDTREEYVKKMEEYFSKVSLHDKRHGVVIDFMKNHSPKTMVDLGSSEGKLLYKITEDDILSKTKITALESNEFKARKIKKLARGNKLKVLHTNVLYPKIGEEDLLPDLLTCIELIEHFDEKDRKRLLRLIRDLYCPQHIILTTPNVEYNVNYGIPEGIFRIRDHKIEYTPAQFQEEVVDFLSQKYEVKYVSLIPEEEQQPTFCIVCTLTDVQKEVVGELTLALHNEMAKETPDLKVVADLTYRRSRKMRNTSGIEPNRKMLHQIQEMHHTVCLDSTGYTIREKELSAGYSARAFLTNEDNIFYMAPTISPCEWTPEASEYLEHPLSCFDYYRARGITTLIGEEKYMGSRGYILAFKDPEHAKAAGYSSPIIINSRGGFPFFEREDDILEKIWKELSSRMDTDFVVLDSEIMPWSLKADGMIKYKFLLPGECAYLSRKYLGIDTTSSKEFVETVNFFGADSNMEIRPFHVLARGNCDTSRGFKYTNVENGFYIDHLKQLRVIEQLSSKEDGSIVRPCAYHIVDLQDPMSTDRSILRWEAYCSEHRGEGFVYKPLQYTNYTPGGYPIQPAIKVRGRRYLQIVYGVDYQEPEYFDILKVRGVRRKRKMAAQEFELSGKILSAFLAGNHELRKRYVSSFLGMENVSFRGVDATL